MEANSQSNPFGVGGNVRVVAQVACVVFDEADGTVVHGHGAICLEGGEMPDERALQQRALDLAKSSQELGSRSLQTIMVDAAELASGSPMRVDLTTRRLVVDDSQPIPSLGERGAAS